MNLHFRRGRKSLAKGLMRNRLFYPFIKDVAVCRLNNFYKSHFLDCVVNFWNYPETG